MKVSTKGKRAERKKASRHNFCVVALQIISISSTGRPRRALRRVTTGRWVRKLQS